MLLAQRMSLALRDIEYGLCFPDLVRIQGILAFDIPGLHSYSSKKAEAAILEKTFLGVRNPLALL